MSWSQVLGLAAAVRICGLGPYGYIMPMRATLNILGQLPATLHKAIRVGPR